MPPSSNKAGSNSKRSSSTKADETRSTVTKGKKSGAKLAAVFPAKIDGKEFKILRLASGLNIKETETERGTRIATRSMSKRNKDDAGMLELASAHSDKTGQTKATPSSNGLGGDYFNVCLLMLLYTLQGIPMGLAGAIPLMLQQNQSSFSDQALFSLVTWPFSLKILWAPIVDSVYTNGLFLGRRKTWMVPSQLLTGVFMIYNGATINAKMGLDPDGLRDSSLSPDVSSLTVLFFTLYFLMATQDIAVDGWSLSILSHKSRGWASTCNTVGQNVGYFVSYVVFLAFNSAAFCNTYIRSKPEAFGMLTLSTFMIFWGYVFLVTTVLVWAFKAEDAEPQDQDNLRDAGGSSRVVVATAFIADCGVEESATDAGADDLKETEEEIKEENLTLSETFSRIWRLLQQPSVRSLIIILLTVRVGTTTIDSAAALKIVEKGIPSETLAIIATTLVPFNVALPLIIGKYTSGPNVLKIWLYSIPVRYLLAILSGAIIYLAPTATKGVETPLWFYYSFFAMSVVTSIVSNISFVCIMSFFTRISDPLIGGTYMTLLNTMANMGYKWPNAISLYMLDRMSTYTCLPAADVQVTYSFLPQGNCKLDADVMQACAKMGGYCATSHDGFYDQVVITFVIGVVWLALFWKRVLVLHNTDRSAWLTHTSKRDDQV